MPLLFLLALRHTVTSVSKGQDGVATRSPENVGSSVGSLGYLDPKYLPQMLPEKTGHMVASHLRLKRKGLRAKLIPN